MQIFVSLSWMAKATVQAALGPVALKRLAQDGNATEEEHKYAEIVLMICVLSIVLTAPIGAILISISGTKLLTKTKPLHVVEGKCVCVWIVDVNTKINSIITIGWRRSHRPSLYDISIIDEEEERDDPEKREELDEAKSNSKKNSVVGRPLPIYTVTK